MKRKTVAERAYISNLLRTIDPLSSSITGLRWKEDAERLLEVVDEDEHVEDLISTTIFYGYVRGLESALRDARYKPFDDKETFEHVTSAWKAILHEYFTEMKRGAWVEDVDN